MSEKRGLGTFHIDFSKLCFLSTTDPIVFGSTCFQFFSEVETPKIQDGGYSALHNYWHPWLRCVKSLKINSVFIAEEYCHTENCRKM